MYHKQANKTAIQSQHMIADALFSLMKRKPFQQITVTEICEEAAVGRKTFYRNFELREDVIDFWLDLRCEECREVLLPVPTEEQLYHYCVFLKKHILLRIHRILGMRIPSWDCYMNASTKTIPTTTSR